MGSFHHWWGISKVFIPLDFYFYWSISLRCCFSCEIYENKRYEHLHSSYYTLTLFSSTRCTNLKWNIAPLKRRHCQHSRYTMGRRASSFRDLSLKLLLWIALEKDSDRPPPLPWIILHPRGLKWSLIFNIISSQGRAYWIFLRHSCRIEILEILGRFQGIHSEFWKMLTKFLDESI